MTQGFQKKKKIGKLHAFIPEEIKNRVKSDGERKSLRVNSQHWFC